MRKEVGNWLKQANKDLEVAEKNIKIEEYYSAVFWCQQAVEKGLKAVYILKHNTLPPKIHDLVEICRLVKAPDNIVLLSGKIVTAYIFSRYPGAAPEMPEDYYDKGKAEEHVKIAKEVLEWVIKLIK